MSIHIKTPSKYIKKFKYFKMIESNIYLGLTQYLESYFPKQITTTYISKKGV